MREKTIKLYTYEELTGKAKEKAYEQLAYINVEMWDWWHSIFEGHSPAIAKLKAAGIAVRERGLAFDLDRADYLYFHKYGDYNKQGVKGEYQGIYIEYPDTFADALKKAGLIATGVKDEMIAGGIEARIITNHYALGSGSNAVEFAANTDKGFELLDLIDEKKCTDWLQSMLEELKKEIRSEYEYHMERKNVEETIINNDYEFLEDGTLA